MNMQTKSPFSGDKRLQPTETVGYAELSEQEKNQILSLQQAIIESLLSDQPTLQIIDNICILEEHLLPNSIGSVMLYDAHRDRLDIFSAPSIPESAHAQFTNIRPGLNSGSCGNTLHQQTPVFVGNTLTDSRWLDFRHLAEAFNLMACWSMPIRGAGGGKSSAHLLCPALNRVNPVYSIENCWKSAHL